MDCESEPEDIIPGVGRLVKSRMVQESLAGLCSVGEISYLCLQGT